MKTIQVIFMTLIFFWMGCVTTESQSAQSVSKVDSKPEKITLCRLQTDPAAYNHQLIEITAFISKGFENFSLFDPGCSSGSGVWLEYGGTAASGTIYCCGVSAQRRRPKQLVVEGIPTTLVDDEIFRQFDNVLQRPPDSMAHATVVGRFFSGKKVETENRSFWAGYGHLGCCSLLVIEQVGSVDSQARKDLDYGTSSDQPDTSCWQFLKGLETGQDLIQAQQRAETESRETAFNNPEQAAISFLAKILKTDGKSIILEQTSKKQGRFVYWWKPGTEAEKYMVVVSRPYWLSLSAKDPGKVMWVVTAAYKTSCN